MENAVKGFTGGGSVFEKVFNSRSICQLAFHKSHARRQQISPPMAQVVVDNRFVSLFGK